MPLWAILFDDDADERSSIARGDRENWLRRIGHHPSGLERAGLRKQVKRVHAVPPIQTAPGHAKASRQASEGPPICDLANTT
jgi:hypothetical protein